MVGTALAEAVARPDRPLGLAEGQYGVGDEQLLGGELREDLGAVSVTTTSSSMRAAEMPSDAGQ